MILSIEGPEGTGKTTLAYTAPLPIVGFSFDMGTKRALFGKKFDEYFDGLDIRFYGFPLKETLEYGDITIFELPPPIQLDQNTLKGNMELWSFFINKLNDAMQGPAKTIVVDTMTLARRLKADAYLQELQEGSGGRPRKQLIQIEWGHANDSIRNIYTLAAGLGKNLIATHHQTDERKDGVDKDGAVVSMLTGNLVLEGLSNTYRYCDIALTTGKSKGDITAKMTKCGYNLDVENTPLLNPSWDSITSMVEMSLRGRMTFDKRKPEVVKD